MRKMSILGEQGTLEEKHLYRLASGMAAGGKQEETHCVFVYRIASICTMYKKQPATGLVSSKGI